MIVVAQLRLGRQRHRCHSAFIPVAGQHKFGHLARRTREQLAPAEVRGQALPVDRHDQVAGAGHAPGASSGRRPMSPRSRRAGSVRCAGCHRVAAAGRPRQAGRPGQVVRRLHARDVAVPGVQFADHLPGGRRPRRPCWRRGGPPRDSSRVPGQSMQIGLPASSCRASGGVFRAPSGPIQRPGRFAGATGIGRSPPASGPSPRPFGRPEPRRGSRRVSRRCVLRRRTPRSRPTPRRWSPPCGR